MKSNNNKCTHHSYKNFFLSHLKLSFIAVIIGMAITYAAINLKIVNSFFSKLGIDFGSHDAFHLFHYPHISLACATAFLNFYRLTKNLIMSCLIGLTVPLGFCILSDILVPYWGAKLAGAEHIHLHLCVLKGFKSVAFFNLIGIFIALVCKYASEKFKNIRLYKTILLNHFLHEVVSAIASASYLASFGFALWHTKIFATFFILIIAVVVPCLLSDLVIPTLIGKVFFKKQLAHNCFNSGDL